MSTRQAPESGLYTGRIEFARESVTGQYETDPAYQFYSDNVLEVTHTAGLNIERRNGLGTPDAAGHDKGNEEPEIEILYHLQKQLVDGNGDPDDASADAWSRDTDGRLKNTHQVRLREDRSSSDPDDPTNADGCRIYVIGSGGHPSVEKELDPENGAPVVVTLTYNCEKVREYEVFQPPGGEALEVASTDAGDTTQTLTIEDDSGTSEDVSLNGDTAVSTTKADWASIQAIELDAETDGDVTVSLASSGDELARIRGASYYAPGDGTLEGDLGVPAVGSGSLATTIGSAFEYFNGASVTRGGATLEYDLNRMTAAVDNNIDVTPRHDSTRMRVNEGNRAATLETDVVGWGASAQYHDEALGVNGEDIVITLASSEITFGSAVPQEPGDKERGPDDTAIEYGVTFEASNDAGVSLSQV